MPFNEDVRPVPEGLRSDKFLLRPIRVADAELDYEAVTESREFLRIWEQSSWPEDNFTVEANRQDLQKLERRHTAEESFTYTIMNPTETQCLGCVYIFAMDAAMLRRSDVSAIDGARWSDYAAAVYLWIRLSRLADALDRTVLNALGPWLRDDWRFQSCLFITNEQFTQQVLMMESAGLRLRFRIKDPKAAGRFLAYGKEGAGG